VSVIDRNILSKEVTTSQTAVAVGRSYPLGVTGRHLNESVPVGLFPHNQDESESRKRSQFKSTKEK
jgi:hypothetical protein